jgi:hypothetical protein
MEQMWLKVTSIIPIIFLQSEGDCPVKVIERLHRMLLFPSQSFTITFLLMN